MDVLQQEVRTKALLEKVLKRRARILRFCVLAFIIGGLGLSQMGNPRAGGVRYSSLQSLESGVPEASARSIASGPGAISEAVAGMSLPVRLLVSALLGLLVGCALVLCIESVLYREGLPVGIRADS